MRLGRQWKNEDEQTKDSYKTKAEEAKRKHLQDHPEYQYQPRKPSEKKRRMTKRKAAALAQLAYSSDLSTTQTSTTSVTPIGTPNSEPTSQISATISSVADDIQVPDVIPPFQLSDNGRLLTHELIPFPVQDDLFAQMIDQHNSAPNLADPTSMHSAFFSFPTAAATSDYTAANALINHMQLESQAEDHHAEMLAAIEKELVASHENEADVTKAAAAGPSNEAQYAAVADPSNIFEQEWNEALATLQSAEEHRMNSLLQTPSAFDDAFIGATLSSPDFSDINFDIDLEEYTQ